MARPRMRLDSPTIFSRPWSESKEVCAPERVLGMSRTNLDILEDELEEDDDNVHSFEIADAKIDVCARPILLFYGAYFSTGSEETL